MISVALFDLPSLDFFGGRPHFRVFPWTIAIVSSPLRVISVSVALLAAIEFVAVSPIIFLLLAGPIIAQGRQIALVFVAVKCDETLRRF